MGYKHCNFVEFVNDSSAVLRDNGVKNAGTIKQFKKGDRIKDDPTFGWGEGTPHALVRYDKKTKTYQIRVQVYLHKEDKEKHVAIYTDVYPMYVVIDGLVEEEA